MYSACSPMGNGRRATVFLAVVGLLTALLAAPATAGDLHDLDKSVKFAPADTAMYISMYNAREVVDRIGQSKAWADLLATPIAKDLLATYEQAGQEDASEDAETFGEDTSEALAQMKSALENPQTRIAMSTIADMLGDDAFVMVGPEATDVIELMQKFQNANTQATVAAGAPGDEELVAATLIQTLDDNLEMLETPRILMGFQVNDVDRAKLQVNTLGGIVAIFCMSNEKLGRALKQEKVGDATFITFTVDGDMIPWDEMPVDDLREVEAKAGQVDRVLARAKEMTVCISVGVLDDYLMIAIDDSAEFLKTLGEGDLLIDRPEMAPLNEFADQNLLGISYVSEDFMTRVGGADDDIDNTFALFQALAASENADIDEEIREELQKDLPKLADMIKEALPKNGAIADITFLTDDGVEGYSFNYGTMPGMVGDQPLTILGHVGGDPLMFFADRSPFTPEMYDSLSDLAKMGLKYFDKLAPAEMSKKELKQFNAVRKGLLPILEEMDEINRELIVPGFADGQSALVVDNKYSSTAYCPMMPESDEPLPFVEPAIVASVSDAEKVKEATVKYMDLIGRTIDVLRETAPNDFPEELQLPEPKDVEIEDGDMLVFDLPKEWGLPSDIRPNMAINETTAVMSLSVEHSQRLLKESALDVGGVLADPSEPMAAAGAFRMEGLVETVGPWIHYAIDLNMDEPLELDGREYSIEQVHEQIDTLLALVGTMKSTTVTIDIQDDVIVSHSKTTFEDVK